jgi:hypothetical protein
MLLGLCAPAETNALVELRPALELIEDREQLVRADYWDVVDLGLESMRGCQRLAKQKMPGGEVHQDTVLKAGMAVAVDVDSDVDA